MKTDITELAQSLKAAAEKATPGPWGVARDGKTLVSNQSHPIATVSDAMHRMLDDGSTGKDAEFIALANPANILALVEALEKAQCAGSINNQWKPDVCPITGRRFFMWIEHPELGYVPTYGGPYDSYTIPTSDGDGDFSCERYDHDVGGWVDGECVGAYLIDDDEQSRVYELEQRIAELEESHAQVIQSREHYKRMTEEGLKQLAESRTVTVKPMRPGHITVGGEKLGIYMRDEVDEFLAALTAAGIKLEAE
ncbi:ead/Ea22-like family protein [Klebsiella michiganensis]|uniref:ead/Ea22-like family protein n=1 Tax=Klebsiella michiganensis TaxID=1134687 RepID=UPI0035D590D8